ncbi:MAG TPA: hypothetical protein VMV83_16280 [Rectinemataceae bacterium]|nr:hypothetical protein [Rectinemataceae bacterium]
MKYAIILAGFGDDLDILLLKLRDLILEALRKAATAVNYRKFATNYQIGRLIVGADKQERQG